MITIKNIQRNNPEGTKITIKPSGEIETLLSEQIKVFLAQQWGVECEINVNE